MSAVEVETVVGEVEVVVEVAAVVALAAVVEQTSFFDVVASEFFVGVELTVFVAAGN